MSVVNKMLQDLEDRNEQLGEAPADYQPSKKSRFSKRGIGVIAVLTIVVAGYAAMEFFALNQKATDSLQEASNQIAEAKNTTQPAQNKGDAEIGSEAQAELSAQSQTELAKPMNNDEQGNPIQVAESLSSDDVLSQLDDDIHQRDPDSFSESFEKLASTYSETAQRVPLDGSVIEEEQIVETGEAQQEGEQAELGELRVSRVGEQTREDKLALMLDEANAAINAEQTSTAIHILDQALELAPDRHDIRKRLAVVLFANQQDKLAESVLTDGVRLSPERVDLRLMLGRMLHRQKKMQSLYHMLKPLSPNVNLHSEYLALKAAAAHQLGQYEEASLLFAELVEFDDARSNWWLGLAIAKDKQGKTEDALNAYRKVIQLQQVSQAVLDFVENRIGVLEN